MIIYVLTQRFDDIIFGVYSNEAKAQYWKNLIEDETGRVLDITPMELDRAGWEGVAL